MRYSLIPTRGLGTPTRHMDFDNDIEALKVAQDWAVWLGVPVLVCHAPIGGLVKDIATVGDFPQKKRG